MMSLPLAQDHTFFINDFADSCGYREMDNIHPEYKYFNIIESLKWCTIGLPSYVKLKPEYEC